MLRIGLLLLLVTVSKQLSIPDFDVPSPVKEGDDALLRCRYKLDQDESDQALFVKWWFSPPVTNDTTDEKVQIYQRIVGHEPSLIHHNIKIVENDDILLLNVTVKDSGIYECEVSNIDEVRLHGELIVYTTGNGVELEVTRTEDGPDEDEDEDVMISCKAIAVAPFPHLFIYVDGAIVNSSEVITVTEGDSYPGARYDAYSNATIYNVDGAEIKCQLHFDNIEITDESLIAVELYNGAAVYEYYTTTESSTEMVSTDATETVDINSGNGFSPSWSAFLLLLLLMY